MFELHLSVRYPGRVERTTKWRISCTKSSKARSPPFSVRNPTIYVSSIRCTIVNLASLLTSLL